MNKNATARISLAVMLATILTGCGLPRYTIGLDRVVLKEVKKTSENNYKYRCTAGAHRGDSVAHKENTIEAIRSACESKNYAFVEFDVQYSSDHKIIVFHDKRLLRLYGKMKKVKKSTYVEMQEATEGGISLYSEVMDVIKKKKKINIEIKSQGEFDDDKKVVDHIVADITKRRLGRKVMMSSISPDVVSYINEKHPDIVTGQVFWKKSSTYLHFDILTEGLYRKIAETKADYLILHVSNLRNIEDLLKLKPDGKTVAFWDFDNAMYVVHKDTSDRLWGDGWLKTFYHHWRYKLLSPFYRLKGFRKKDRKPRIVSTNPASIQTVH